MLTFEQFYKEFLVEAKYLPGAPRPANVLIHAPHYNIHYNNGEYSLSLGNNNNNIGTIVISPRYERYIEGLNRPNIHAALGVLSRDTPINARNNTQSKLYTFHLAKYKLDRPGPIEGNNEDIAFFYKTINETARLLSEYLTKNRNKAVSIIMPFSRNIFNKKVIEYAREMSGHANINTIVVTKRTFADAAQHNWTTNEDIKGVIKDFTNDQKSISTYVLIQYLKNLIVNNDGAVAELQNKQISLETLAQKLSSLWQGVDTRELVQNFARNLANGINNNSLHDEILKFANSNNNLQKGWILAKLKSVYFNNIEEVINDVVAIVDDNINSGATFEAVIKKIADARRANNLPPMPTNIQWFVGIIPLKQ